MLYISAKVTDDVYTVYDTDDETYNNLSYDDVLRLNKFFKTHGVVGNDITIFDPFKMYKRWKLLGVENVKLDGIPKRHFFGRILDIFCVSSFYDNITLLRFKSDSKIEEINIPDGVNRLDLHLFENLSSLQKVLLPESVNNISDLSFTGCPKLKEVDFSKCKINILPKRLFNNCEQLTKILLPNTLETIGSHAFNNCTSLRNISIPCNTKNIHSYAFYYCTRLEELYLPDSVEYIGEFCFMKCVNLKTLRLPKEYIEYVRNKEYDKLGIVGCYSLEKIIVGDEEFNIKF